MLTLISDETEETHRNLFRFFWGTLGALGRRRALMAPGCTFLFDFELPPIQAATLELPILVKGCFFHFT
ncbi:hypothetical protein V3C99_004728 [Haemonchus contortus]